MSLTVSGKLLRNGICGCNNELCVKTVISKARRSGRTVKGGHELLLKCIPLLYNQRQYFRHQSIIQFHIQRTHGILFEALQKSRAPAPDVTEIKIPEELKRLKAGSLKWLFQFWPAPKNMFSALSSTTGSQNHGGFGGGVGGNLPKTVGKVDPQTLLIRSKACNEKQLHEMVEYLKEKKIAIRRLIKLPWLLTGDPAVVEESAKRVKSILGLSDFKVAISFVGTSPAKLIEASMVWKREKKMLSDLAVSFADKENDDDKTRLMFQNRIDYLAYRLQCGKEDVSDMMSKVKVLLIKPLQEIEEVLECLLEGGVPPDSIVNDPWIFIHNLDMLQERIVMLHQQGLQNFKPWLLRANKDTFDKHVAKRREEMELLADCEDICGFLQAKLNCDEKAVSQIFARHSVIKDTSVVKLNEMLEFLFSAGYSAEQILETPRVLAHSVDTISQRLLVISQYQKTPVALHTLCRTTKDFNAILRKLKRLSEARKSSNEKSSN